MTITAGTRFGPYQIAAPLGKGGMGEVYLAEDERLRRKVALKLLPTEFTQDSERLRRFEHEAQATSALNHPNIITIFEIGAASTEDGDTHFITTEYIPGQTLRERMQHPLTQVEAIDIALQIANALAAAHEAHIIHRDIKPENVMLRNDGIVKVLDFGLAKLTERKSHSVRLGEDDPTLALPANSHTTEAGTVMGTASYMSPEQARGEKVDARTDIFSLGVVLYEMLASQRPFEGVNTIDVLGAILHQEPAPLTHVSDELQCIVTRALQKDRTQRYASIQALHADLKALQRQWEFDAEAHRRTLGAQRKRVPVSASDPVPRSESAPSALSRASAALPEGRASLLAVAALLVVAVTAYFFLTRQATPAFTEREPLLLADFENKTGEEIWDGTLKQALAVALEQSPYMNIFPEERARDTLRLMNRSVDEPITRATGREICQRRNVRALLVGTITRLERSYTVTLEAMNAQSGETIARALEQAAGRDDVMKAVERAAKGLRGKLGESLATLRKFDKPLEEATTSSLEALKSYSLALAKKQQGNQQESIPFFLRAVELDPTFALAYHHLASANENLDPARAVEYAEKAYQLRDRVSEQERLAITGFYHFFVRGDLEKEAETHKLSVQTYPGKSLIHGYLSWDYYSLGQTEKAIEESRIACALAPDNPVHVNQLAESLLLANRFEEAKQTILQAQARQVENTYFHRVLYWIGFAQNDEALMRQQITSAQGKAEEYRMRGVQAQAATFAGRFRDASALFAQAVAQARQQQLPKVAAQYQIEAALLQTVSGLKPLAQTNLTQALQLSPDNFTHAFVGELLPLGPLAFALIGNLNQAQTFCEETARLQPHGTITNFVWLSAARAAIELQRNNPGKAVELLQPAVPYEPGAKFWPNWVRAQAYLQLKQGAQAAAEFQRIIDHRGWDVTSPLWPLAHLGLARAAVFEGDAAKAKQLYDEFFRLWKDADADLPVLLEAKKEYERLK